MSDLQIVLMVIGGIIIVAVLVFNWWQERRFHQQVEDHFSSVKSDALLDGPSLDSSSPYDAEGDISHDDFSINHDLMNEAQAAAVESSKIEPSINIPESLDDVLFLETEPDRSAVTGNDTLADESTANNPFAEITSANHDGIKAIFTDAFNQNPHAGEAPETSISSMQSIVDEVAPEPSASSLPAMLHAQTDWIAVLHLKAESTVEKVLKVLRDEFDTCDKPVFIHVQTPDQRWLLLSDISAKPNFFDQKVSKISCSLQLADRAGPVSRSILNRFQLAVESMGLDVDAHVAWQSATDPAIDAEALDAFCIEVDKTMGFHLVNGENGAFTGTKLRGLAEAQGLELTSDGSFKYHDEASRKHASVSTVPSFVMFNRDHHPFSPEMLRSSVVKGITFQLDIPHVTDCTEAYNQMVLVAKQMETGLHAQLVDDNNRPLGDVQIEKIRHQLKIIQATMMTRGIVPGSDVAHRLFS